MVEPTPIRGKRRERRYPKATKSAAMILAEQTSTNAAAEQMGIPEATVRYWMEQPEFAEIRERAREGWSDEVLVVARRAWEIIANRLNGMSDKDLIDVADMASDKAQLLSGEATDRSETRTLTDILPQDDVSRKALRDIIDIELERRRRDPA